MVRKHIEGVDTSCNRIISKSKDITEFERVLFNAQNKVNRLLNAKTGKECIKAKHNMRNGFNNYAGFSSSEFHSLIK